MKRRKFIGRGISALMCLSCGPVLSAQSSTGFFMPEEGARHKRTWMAFGAHRKIWGKKLAEKVQREIALIANTIAKYEPVSMLVRPTEMGLAKRLLDYQIQLEEAEMDDIWIRDTGPIFVFSKSGGKIALDFNFNGWGNKQEHGADAKVAFTVARLAGAGHIRADAVLEGGSIEVDGNGTAVMTESSTLNPNRNPNLKKSELEEMLLKLLGINKIIWLPGVANMEITDGHVDFYVRFAKPGTLFAAREPDTDSPEHEITARHLAILKSATDADGKKLEIIVLDNPHPSEEIYISEDMALGYLGFYVCNDAVICQKFGDEYADQRAFEKIRQAYPERRIEAININSIASGGGSIHCATQQEPLSPET